MTEQDVSIKAISHNPFTNFATSTFSSKKFLSHFYELLSHVFYNMGTSTYKCAITNVANICGLFLPITIIKW